MQNVQLHANPTVCGVQLSMKPLRIETTFYLSGQIRRGKVSEIFIGGNLQ